MELEPIDVEMTLPQTLPVMTLPEVAFFPQALQPLHIYEPRYRKMLRDVLSSNRLMAIAGLKAATEGFEPPQRVACAGIIRACQKNSNGTSNLLLQGLVRVEVVEIVSDTPYRRILTRPLTSSPGAALNENKRLRDEVGKLLGLKAKLNGDSPVPMMQFLESVDDPEIYVDIAAFNFCETTTVKQRLLETLDVHHRLNLFAGHLRQEIEAIKLRRRLQGKLPDDQIASN